MYLMDAIAQMDDLVRHGELSAKVVTDPALRVFPDLMDKLQGTPRFLLEKDAIEAVVELTLGRPKIILEALAHLRLPYPRMWVEWDESHRDRLRQHVMDPVRAAEVEANKILRPVPVRLGFLLEGDPGGRSGMATWAWQSPKSTLGPLNVPNIAPISPHFDFDQRWEQGPWRTASFLSGNLAELWGDNEVQLNALLGLWEKADHKLNPWGKTYFERVGATDERLAHAFADVYGEWIGIIGVLLLLTSSRRSVDYRAVDRAKLNKHRARKKEAPLLDHTEVVMHTRGRGDGMRQMRLPLGHQRKSPRIHMVSRYLARRGDKHWLVEPYVRGSGDAIHRVTKVRQ